MTAGTEQRGSAGYSPRLADPADFRRFPGAPRAAVFTAEGWMVWGDEAWTEHEWRLLTPRERRQVTGDQPAWDEGTPEPERVSLKRRLADMPAGDRAAYKREWQRRHRAKRAAP
jgi:hypothetical protein